MDVAVAAAEAAVAAAVGAAAAEAAAAVAAAVVEAAAAAAVAVGSNPVDPTAVDECHEQCGKSKVLKTCPFQGFCLLLTFLGEEASKLLVIASFSLPVFMAVEV